MNPYEGTLRECSFPGWSFRLDYDQPSGWFLQVRATTPCARTGEALSWSGRKWRLSPHMTKSEIVQTAFKAVLTAVEHEAREAFRYREQAIFGPHHDVEALVRFCRESPSDVRR